MRVADIFLCILQTELIRQYVVAAELPLPVGKEMLCGGKRLQAKWRETERADILNGLRLGKRALSIGKFIKPRKKALFRTLPECNPFLIMNQKDRVMTDGPRLLRRHFRKKGRSAVLSGLTKGGERAGMAEGLSMSPADTGAEIHQRLIEVPGTVGRNAVLEKEECLLAGSGLPDTFLIGREPREDPQEISVDGGHRLLKGNGGNGRCRIGPDAGDFFKLRRGSRHFPVIIRQNLLCPLVEISHPGIVAEPLPELQIQILRRPGQCGNVRQCREEALIIRQHRLHPGLLQHDL